MAQDAIAAQAEIAKLRFQLARYRRAEFGRSSEKLAHEVEQLELAIEALEADQAELLAAGGEDADHRHRLLLRAGGKRPCERRTPENADSLASLHLGQPNGTARLPKLSHCVLARSLPFAAFR